MVIPDGFWADGLDATVDRLNQCLIQFDTAANRPAAAANTKGMLFFSTDTQVLSYDNGGTWVEVDIDVVASKVVGYSRSAAAASGSESLTGAGFLPTAAIAYSRGTDNNESMCWGNADSGSIVNSMFIRALSGTPVISNPGSVLVQGTDSGGTNGQAADHTSFNSDGMTVQWTKSGSGEAVNYVVIYFR